MGECIFKKNAVVSITLNTDTVAGDGIGGAISVVTKDKSPEKGFFNQFHNAVFSDDAMPKVKEFVDELEQKKGVKVNKGHFPNNIFVKSFP
jgi:D-Tyr-tRNAtyr deacylase